ncbi:hypothetical protein QBC47DRAFT_198111 [Echria macrotheca]|uniref:Extracellular membrane protein CFEM domain-containing protein n=1 Tax=Echria macrotheca TaxID=438768 RepID=A0AAJ0BDG8_9PEZI|nr:hypothetical protein QBC47DRAFT_198111 [Echria macrotheca]
MRNLPPTLLAFVFASVYRLTLASVIDFSFYPTLAQDCLYQASNSSNCAADTVAATNTCLCHNGGDFVTNAASCLGRSDPSDVQAVYDTMKTACSNSNTPLSVSEKQYLAAAASPSSTPTVSASSTATPTATATVTATTAAATSSAATGGGTGSGVSVAVVVAVSVGSVVGTALVAGLAFFLIRRRRRRNNEESHPMLPPEHGSPSHALLPPHGEAGHGSVGWVEDAKWRPTVDPGSGRSPGFGWESPNDFSYPKPPPPLTPTPPLQPHTRFPSQHASPYVFELAGSDRQPSEMPGSATMEMEGSPVPRQGEWRYHGAPPDAVDTSYPPQVARRTSR